MINRTDVTGSARSLADKIFEVKDEIGYFELIEMIGDFLFKNIQLKSLGFKNENDEK